MKGSFEESAERENKVRGNLFMQHFSFSFSFLACNLPTVNKQQRTFHLVCFRSVIVPSLQVSHLSWQTQMFASVSPPETWKTAHSDGSWVKVLTVFASQLRWTSSAGDNKGFLGGGTIPGCRIYDGGEKLHHSLGCSSLKEMQHNFIDPLWAIPKYSGEKYMKGGRVKASDDNTTTQQHNNRPRYD